MKVGEQAGVAGQVGVGPDWPSLAEPVVAAAAAAAVESLADCCRLKLISSVENEAVVRVYTPLPPPSLLLQARPFSTEC